MGYKQSKEEKALLSLTDSDGNFLLNIPDYYEKYVTNIDNKFRGRDLYSNPTVICPLHDDHDPSFGTVKTKEGYLIGHCFGCGAWVDVFSLHQKVEEIWKNRKINKQTAYKEVAEILRVDLKGVTQETEKDVPLGRRILEKSQDYSLYDFRMELLEAKKQNKSMAYVNGIFTKMLINSIENE